MYQKFKMKGCPKKKTTGASWDDLEPRQNTIFFLNFAPGRGHFAPRPIVGNHLHFQSNSSSQVLKLFSPIPAQSSDVLSFASIFVPGAERLCMPITHTWKIFCKRHLVAIQDFISNRYCVLTATIYYFCYLALERDALRSTMQRKNQKKFQKLGQKLGNTRGAYIFPTIFLFPKFLPFSLSL